MRRTRKRNGPDLPNASARAIWLVLLMTASVCNSSESDVPAPDALATDCIASPDDWVTHWDHGEWNCVAPSLFATVFFPDTTLSHLYDNYLYPCYDQENPCKDGFRYAWAFSNTNLELALELKQRYPDDSTRVSSAFFSLIGFTGVENYGSADKVYLAVYTLPGGERPLVPTWETWFRLLDELAAETESLQDFYSDKDIQARLLRAQQTIVHAYSVVGRSDPKERHQDVVAVYGRLSGCPRTTMISAPDEEGTGTDAAYSGLGVAPQNPRCDETTDACWAKFDESCSGNYPAYKEFMVGADLKSPYAGADSKECFVKALTYLQDNPDVISATTLRAMIAQCQDANMLNTGAGLGYNTYPNPTSYQDECGAYWDPAFRPHEQTVLERLTGREFIVLNRRLEDLPRYAHVSLGFGEKGSPRRYLVDGYCE